MKKLNESLKLPPFRNSTEKRRINNSQAHLNDTKPQFGQEIGNDELLTLTQQGDIAKRIQGKLRMRKMGSQKRSSREESGKQSTAQRASLQLTEVPFEARLEQLWENSAAISQLLEEHSSVPAKKIKQRVMKQAGLLRCQIGELQDLMVGRLRRLCQLMASQQRCGEHENQLSRLLDERMRKLADTLRTR